MSGTPSASQLVLCAQPPTAEIVLPRDINPARAEAIRIATNKWVNGTVLHFCFCERQAAPAWSWADDQMQVVRWAFGIWAGLGIGLKFVEVADPSEAEVRIGCLQDGRSWSFVGTDILRYNDLGRTMNFGWDLTTTWGRATALHEIGHTLGLAHEHQNPLSGIVWDEAEVYRHFMGPPNNWDRPTVYNNIIKHLERSSVDGGRWDPTSIMHYPFEPGLISMPQPYDTLGIGQNTSLSQADVTWVTTFYPPMNNLPKAIGLMQMESLDVAPSAQRDFVFTPDATRKYTIQTIGESDCKVIVFVERDGVPRYLTGEDDSGTPDNARIVASLVKGETYVIRVRVHYVTSPSGVGLVVY